MLEHGAETFLDTFRDQRLRTSAAGRMKNGYASPTPWFDELQRMRKPTCNDLARTERVVRLTMERMSSVDATGWMLSFREGHSGLLRRRTGGVMREQFTSQEATACGCAEWRISLSRDGSHRHPSGAGLITRPGRSASSFAVRHCGNCHANRGDRADMCCITPPLMAMRLHQQSASLSRPSGYAYPASVFP
jgi:hypothetical protein